MATATATVTLDAFPFGVDVSQRMTFVFGTIAVQASPATYATGGLALSFVGEYPKVLNQTPRQVYIQSVAGGTFVYQWNKATNKLQIFADAGGAAQAAPFVELANLTAIPAAVSGDTIQFEATFENAL